MFKAGDTVMHPGMGVCRITQIKTENFNKMPPKEFYVLEPMYDNAQTKIYVPVGGKIKLRKLLSCEDIEAILSSQTSASAKWIENDALRKETFLNILKSGDHKEMLLMIRLLHENRIEKAKKGKKMHLADEKILKDAEKMIHQELGYALNINPDEVGKFIMEKSGITDEQ